MISLNVLSNQRTKLGNLKNKLKIGEINRDKIMRIELKKHDESIVRKRKTYISYNIFTQQKVMYSFNIYSGRW
jgi:hypothetical protein